MQIHMQMSERHDEPFAVIVFPIFDGHVIWVKHPRRGWEVPGGKVEQGETPEAAAVREVFEESGAEIAGLVWLAEYETSDGRRKWVYTADVTEIRARPQMSETTDVCVPRPMWTPGMAQSREDVSFIMKDEMYEVVWPHVLERLHAQDGARAASRPPDRE